MQKNLLVTAELFVNLSLVFSVTTVRSQNLTRVTFSVYINLFNVHLDMIGRLNSIYFVQDFIHKSITILQLFFAESSLSPQYRKYANKFPSNTM